MDQNLVNLIEASQRNRIIEEQKKQTAILSGKRPTQKSSDLNTSCALFILFGIVFLLFIGGCNELRENLQRDSDVDWSCPILAMLPGVVCIIWFLKNKIQEETERNERESREQAIRLEEERKEERAVSEKRKREEEYIAQKDQYIYGCKQELRSSLAYLYIHMANLDGDGMTPHEAQLIKILLYDRVCLIEGISNQKIIHVTRKGKPYGPYQLNHAIQYYKAGSLLPTDLGRQQGGDNWIPLNELLSENSTVIIQDDELNEIFLRSMEFYGARKGAAKSNARPPNPKQLRPSFRESARKGDSNRNPQSEELSKYEIRTISSSRLHQDIADSVSRLTAGHVSIEQKIGVINDLEKIATVDGVMSETQYGELVSIAAQLPGTQRAGVNSKLYAITYLYVLIAYWDLDGVTNVEADKIHSFLHEWDPAVTIKQFEDLMAKADISYEKDMASGSMMDIFRAIGIVQRTMNKAEVARLFEQFEILASLQGKHPEQENFILGLKEQLQ